MFPSQDELPRNIKFYHQNLLEPFPTELIGQYDVVNIRLMVVALSAGEWGPAVRNLMTLLSMKSLKSNAFRKKANKGQSLVDVCSGLTALHMSVSLKGCQRENKLTMPFTFTTYSAES